jgi:hypothetical protein
MNEKLKALNPHVIAIAIFIGFSSMYFSPLFDGFNLKQGDIKQFQGMSKEIVDYRIQNGKEPLWTNSMFSGMPAYQTSVIHENNYLLKVDKLLKLEFALPRAVGLMFLAMLGFYIFALCIRVNPWLGIVGAVAFGFSTINILYIGAGHMTKVNAITYMAPALGGLILAFRGKWLLGSVLFALFFGLNVTANHLQMTYYLVFLLFAVAVAEGIRLILEKQFIELGKVAGGLAIGGVLGLLPSMSNLKTTLEYSKYTTRGATDLSIEPKGQTKNQSKKEGLDIDYILEYNYGKNELLSVIAPNAKGAKNDYLGNDEDIMLNVNPEYSQQIGQMDRYWGGQRMSGGGIYFGVVMFVFFIFGLIFLKDSLKWPFLVLTLLCLALAAKDPGGINHFFIHKFPLYNKFRDSKMILVLMQVMIPALGVLFLDRFFKNEQVWGDKKKWLIAAGSLLALGLIFILFPGISGTFLKAEEVQQFAKATKGVTDIQQLSYVNGLKSELVRVRTEIYKSEFIRTLLLIFVACGLILISVYTKISKLIVTILAFAFVIGDNMSVSKRYLNNEEIDGVFTSYEESSASILPTLPQQADLNILEEESKTIPNFTSKVQDFKAKMLNTPEFSQLTDISLLNQLASFSVLSLNSDYRVLSFANPFNETGTSYFHKSIGGYHGAKLKRYQELIDFYIGDEINQINQEISAAKNVKLREYATSMEITKEQAQSVFDSIQINEIAIEKASILNMLNVKYIQVDKTKKSVKNTNANGNAWFASKLIRVKSANEEMLALGRNDLKNSAIVNLDFYEISTSSNVDSNATIKLSKYDARELTYQSKNSFEAPAIFSEIWYPEGWNCYIDGKQTVKIFRANYVLRGAIIPAGSHEVVWKFEPETFNTSSLWSLIGSATLLLTLLGVFTLEIKQNVASSNKDDKEQ